MKIIFLFLFFTLFLFFAEKMMGQRNPEEKLCFVIYSTETKKVLTKASASRHCYHVFNKCY